MASAPAMVAKSSEEENKVTAAKFIEGLKYSGLPAHLLTPPSTFPAELEAFLLRHLSSPIPEDAAGLAKRQIEQWTAPSSVFFECRASFQRYGTHAYDRSNKTLTRLDDGGERGETDSSGQRVLPMYQILSSGYRKGLDEKPVRIQARSTNWPISHDHRTIESHHERQELDVWLGKDIIRLAEDPDVRGSWVSYVRNLVGLSDTASADTPGTITPIELPLSSLIVLFLKCSNTSTATFPFIGDDGCWRLPAIEGNQGKDEHIFYNATDEVMVTVV